jgi:hypothetical protein
MMESSLVWLDHSYPAPAFVGKARRVHLGWIERGSGIDGRQ